MTSHNSNLQAILIICVSYLGFSIADTFSKVLGQSYNLHQILVTTGGIGFFLTGLWVYRQLGWRGFVPAERKRWHFFRAVCVACIPLSVIQALQHLPMADFYGIAFCSPFITLILSALLLKERVGPRRWAAVAVGFIGVLVIAGPEYEQFGKGVFFAISSALFVALSIITVRKIGPNAPRPHYIFFPFCAIFAINLIALPLFGEFHEPPVSDAWKFLVLIAFVMISQLGFAIGHTKASEAAVTAPFLYTQIIWGVLFGWLIFGDIPAETTWIGSAIVISAGLFSVWREYRIRHAIR